MENSDKLKTYQQLIKKNVLSLPGGGPQYRFFCIMEYRALSNKSANCVKPDLRFKFVDDLKTLEKINILMVGLLSFNSKEQFPNDILKNNLLIPGENPKVRNI